MTKTQFVRDIKLSGCVVTEDRLRRIDVLARNVVGSTPEKPAATEFEVSVASGKMFAFQSLEALLGKTLELDEALTNVSMEYRLSESLANVSTESSFSDPRAAVLIDFQGSGAVEVGAFGAQPDLEFNVGRLASEIQMCDQRQNWLVRGLLISRFARAILVGCLVLASFIVLFSTVYYLYARSSGINIDESLVVHDRSDYIKQVEKAIGSPSMTEKLDVLLRGELQYFTNVKDILAREEVAIVRWTFVAGCLGVLLLVQTQLRRLFPRAFFAFGRQKERLERIIRYREIWTVGIILAFAINLLAGLVVAYLF